MTVVLLYFGVGGLFPNDFGLHWKCSHFEAELFRGGELERRLCSKVCGCLERWRSPWVWGATKRPRDALGDVLYVIFKSVLLFKNLLKTLSNSRLILENQCQLSSQFFGLLCWSPVVGCGPYRPPFLKGGLRSWWVALHLVMNPVLRKPLIFTILLLCKPRRTLELLHGDHE